MFKIRKNGYIAIYMKRAYSVELLLKGLKPLGVPINKETTYVLGGKNVYKEER